MELTYEQLKPANYLNSPPIGTIAEQDMILQDIVTAGLLGKLNFICRGQKSAGKTQLMRDIYNNYFGGEEHSLWEMGRADFKPNDLFQKLNISLAKGQIGSVPEMKLLYDPAHKKMTHFVRSFFPGDNGPELRWTQITEEEAKTLIERNSTTTDNIVQLKNTGKHFFCIDEYNRCPEVIMNLFYGLMTGEINHQGKIINLGNGYYSGMAAVNPEDYSGTFKMDYAMWARFHVALDFDAYRISTEDKDELVKRNLSPDVHTSEPKNLLPQILEMHEKIKAKQPTREERFILQYLQTGMDTCTKLSKSKEIIPWPRECTTQACNKSTNLCGLFKGIDARAIRAVYRLAKGLEEVAKLKAGNEKLVINPLESIILAYKFVAPYKGCVNPKAAKEHNGIESLVINESIDALHDEIAKKLNTFNELLEKEKKQTGNTFNSIPALIKQFKDKGIQKDYTEIEEATRAKYTETKQLTFPELKKENPELIEEHTKKSLSKEVKNNTAEYIPALMKHVAKEHPNTFANLEKLAKGVTKEEYKKFAAGKPNIKPFKEINDMLKKQHDTELEKIRDISIESSDSEELTKVFNIPQSKITKIESDLEKTLKQGVTFMPDSKKPLYEQELKKALTSKLREKNSDDFKQEKEKLFKEETEFAKHFYNEALNGGEE
ncbi:MAG: hypothetical protein ABIH53_01580 [archaeon]